MPIYKLASSPTAVVSGDTEASLYSERTHPKNGIESPHVNGTVDFRRQQSTDERQTNDNKVVRSTSEEEVRVKNRKESIIQREVRELRQREAELAALHDELQGNKAPSTEVSTSKQEPTRVEPTTPKEAGGVKPVAMETERGRMTPTPPPPPPPSSIIIYNPATPTTTASNDLETSSGAKRVLNELKEMVQREEELRRQRREMLVELETRVNNDVPLSSTESKPAAEEGQVDSSRGATGKDEADGKKKGLFIVLPKHDDPTTVASKGQYNKQDDTVTPKSPKNRDAGTKQEASKHDDPATVSSKGQTNKQDDTVTPKSPKDRDAGTKQEAKMASTSSRNSFDESSLKSPGSATRNSQKVRPFESVEAIQSEFLFQFLPQVESPIDREIRLVREREEALRLARGIVSAFAGVSEDEAVEVSLARSSVKDDDDPFEVKMKKFAEERMRTELEREKKREIDLKREGKVVVLSEQRTPDIIKHVTLVQPERERSPEYSRMTSQEVRTAAASAAGHYSPSPSPSTGDSDHIRKLLIIEIEDNKKRENELREQRRSVGSAEISPDSAPDGRAEENKNRDTDQKRTIKDHVDGSGSSRSSPSDRRSPNRGGGGGSIRGISLTEELKEEEGEGEEGDQWERNKRREPNRLAIIEQWEKGVIQSSATP